MTSTRHGATGSGDSGGAQTSNPPAWALPRTVPLNLDLVRRPELYARVTSVCAFPVGFLFFLVVGFDIRKVPFPKVDFYSPREKRHPAPARVQVRFPDERVVSSHPQLPGDALLRYDGGGAHPCEPGPEETDTFRQHETRWWVSPLPPPGDLEFAVYLRDTPEPAGTGRCDTRIVLEAASQAVTAWAPEGNPR